MSSNRAPRGMSTPTSRRGSTISRQTPQNGAMRNNQVFSVPSAYLPSMFRGTTVRVEDVKAILRALRSLQEMAGDKHRFHLFMESELGEVQSGSSSEMFDHISTRMLFSPTISPYNEDEDDQLSLFIRVLNGISFQNMSATSRTERSPTIGVQGGSQNQRSGNEGTRLHPRRLFDSDDEDDDIANELPPANGVANGNNAEVDSDTERSVIEKGLKLPGKASWPDYIRRCVRLPYWFPFGHDEYKSPPQTSSEILYVEEEFVQKFEFEDPRYVRWIYREFFRYIYNEAKRRSVKGLSRTLKYSDFTPPWIRSRIVKGTENDMQGQNPLFLAKVAVTDIRDQRSTWGVKRLTFILAAFFQEEPSMSSAPLNHLIYELHSISRQQGKKRKGSPLAGPSRSTRFRRLSPSLQQDEDSTEQRGMDHEQERLGGLTFGREYGSSNVRAGNPTRSRSQPAASHVTSQPERHSVPPVRPMNRILENVVIPIPPDGEHTVNQAPVRTQPSPAKRNIEPSGSGSEDERDQLFSVRCAAGSSCKLRDSIIYQTEQGFERNGITGRCRECNRPLHDICGGGEDGDMLCPPCIIVRSRREITLR